MSDPVVVVGGGILGLALAFELTEREIPCEVWERGQPGHGASRAAAGMLAPVSEAEEADGPLVALALDSRDRYPDFVQRVEAASGRSVGYRADGTLWLAVRRDDLGELERLRSILSSKGLTVERLDGAALRRREPFLSGRVHAGLSIPGDHQIDPRALAAGLVAALDTRGVAIHAGRPVERVDRDGAGWVLTLEDGERRPARRVVLAAGAWLSRVSGTGLRPVPVRPVKGQLVRLADAPPVRHVLRSPEVYLVPRGEGELLVGATVEEMGFDTRVTAGAVLELLREAWTVLPGIEEAEVTELCVGLRPALADHRPRIGEWDRDVWIAAGHYRNGVLLAPATAALLADRIAGRGLSPLLESFVPEQEVR